MIINYRDHAANERTFLAWVRTGIAVIAFGFLIEKFDLFLSVLVRNASLPPDRLGRLERYTGLFGRYDGLALVLVGIVLIVVAGIRYVRTAREIDRAEPIGLGVRTEVLLSAVLALLALGICIYLVVR